LKSSIVKLLNKARANPAGLRFSEVQRLCLMVGMTLDRVSGSHFIYKHKNPTFIQSLQKMKDGKAKPFQVRQLLDSIDKYDLEREE
jgi:hypothetical protein